MMPSPKVSRGPTDILDVLEKQQDEDLAKMQQQIDDLKAKNGNNVDNASNGQRALYAAQNGIVTNPNDIPISRHPAGHQQQQAVSQDVIESSATLYHALEEIRKYNIESDKLLGEIQGKQQKLREVANKIIQLENLKRDCDEKSSQYVDTAKRAESTLSRFMNNGSL